MAIVASQVAAVQQLYVSYFGRPADPAGLDYWTNIVEAQDSTAAVSATFAASAEYKAAYEGKTNAQIVDQLYTNLFGRPADATGRAYWVDLLDKGTIKVDTIVYEVSLAALTTDKEAVENKVAAATAFTAALDTEAEVAGYSGDAALVLAKAFITGVTTDATLATATEPAALAATVAAVVASGTEFTLEGAMANYEAAVAAKNAALLGLADNEAVAAYLEANDIDDPEAADITAALTAITNEAEGDIDGIIAGFSDLTVAQQTANIAKEEADLAARLNTQTTAATTGLNARTAAVEAVANLGAAYEDYTAAVEAREAAVIAADLAVTAQGAAISNVGTLNGGTFAAVAGVYTFTPTAGGDATPLIRLNTAGDAYVLANGVTEARFEGVTAALNALNANRAAQKELTDSITAEEKAYISADILDSRDANANLEAVAETFKFVQLGDDVLPTYQQILDEEEFFVNQLDSLDARVGGGKGSYATKADALETAVANVMAGATPVVADLKAALNVGVADKVITQAQANAIEAKFAATDAGETAVNEALYAVNISAQHTDFLAAVNTLLVAEVGARNADGSFQKDADGNYIGGDADVGTLVNNLLAQQALVDETNEDIADLAEAVEAYNAAKALNDTVAAADKAIAAAVKVFTTEGYVAPVTLSSAITLATAKDDLFLAGSTDVSLRNFGAQGDDVLYVGKGLTYNDTEIGSGTGQTAIGQAGDDSVLEFFLQQSGNNVIVHVESKAFGSTSATDITKITLVGVDLEDLVIDNGFITV